MSDLWREWVEKAEEDFRIADAALRLIPGDNFDTACFHAQQCVEKLLKAILVRAGADVPRTHDLRRLSVLVTAVYLDWSADEEVLVRLTHAAVLFRYPGGRATADEARELLRDAADLRLLLRSALSLDPPDSSPSTDGEEAG
jgi:HEPN domain-containing protein